MRISPLVPVVALLGALAAADSASASTFSWTLTGASTLASGSLTTAGDASSFEALTSFTGIFNGSAINGLLPLASDPNFFYDNLFRFSGGIATFSIPGILFDTAAFGHVNVGDFGSGTSYLIYFTGTPGTPGGTHSEIDLKLAATPIAAAVPEPETYALLLAGLAGVGAVARRRRGGSRVD